MSESTNITSLPLLSVCIITYNQERYIEQALQSVLNQQVDFPWEVIIADDCSTDQTRAIIHRYTQQRPELIRLILQPKNVGPANNFIQLIKSAKGKYIAYIEGDDYWTTDKKLQKQIDFLETNSDFSIAFHNTREIHEDDSRPPFLYCGPSQKEVTGIEDILLWNYIPSCSVIFRNRLSNDLLPDWFTYAPIQDWPLHILNAQHGKIRYFNDVMGVHRIHTGGVWTQKSQIRNIKLVLKTYNYLKGSLDYKYKRLINQGRSDLFFQLMNEYIKTNQKWKAAKSLAWSYFLSSEREKIGRRGYLQLLYRIFRSVKK